MKLSAAEKAKGLLLGGAGELDDSIREVMNRCDPELANIYRRLAGNVIGLIYTNLLMPIFAEHPALEPAELRSVPQDKPLFPTDLGQKLLGLFSELAKTIEQAVEPIGEDGGGGSFKGAVAEVLQALGDAETFVKKTSG